MASEGWLFDGQAAIRYALQASRRGDGIALLFRDGVVHEVPAAQLTHVDTRGNAEVYGRTDKEGWRLGLVDPDAELREVLPRREEYGRWVDRIGLVPAVIAGIVLSGFVLLAGGLAPSLLAPFVPRSVERKFGNALVGDLGGRSCAGKGGQAALDKLARELTPEAGDLRVRVVYVPVVNAVALPGGSILIFDELLKQADSPEEVAGVLAHEITHVEKRHTTQSMIRELGLNTVVVAFGGTTAANIEHLMSARYSRDAEREADEGAIRALKQAGISPLPTASFFDRMAKQEAKIGSAGGGIAYLSSHPVSTERERNFRASAIKGGTYRKSLTRDEWDALVDICFNDPLRDQKRVLPRL